MFSLAHELNDLRAWGVMGNDLRTRKVLCDLKLIKLAKQFYDLKAWAVTGNALRILGVIWEC